VGSAAPASRNAPAGAYGAQGVVVEAGLSEQALVALRALHRAWALEEFGKPMNEEAWHHHVLGLACSGLWVPLIAWAGDEAVGCMELYIHHDPIEDVLVGFGDRAFVAEEYREGGAFRAMYEAINALGVALGTGKHMIPVGVGRTGEFLRAFYERDGYTISGYTLKKEIR